MNKNFLRDLVRAVRARSNETADMIARLNTRGHLAAHLVGGPTFDEMGPTVWAENGNLVVDEGLIYDLAVAIANGTKIAQWYVAPYKNNVAPQANWKASTIASNLQEWTNYGEATRPALIFPGGDSLTATTVANDATAITTVGGGADKTLWGGAIVSAQAKSAASGKMWGAVQFPAARAGLQTGDVLAWVYSLTASNPSA